MKKTICLTMIVKDEGHVILDTLNNLSQYFKFDCYAISDTGSSDDTKAKITEFFKKAGIPGEVYDDPWKNFGHNRTRAFEHAYKKSDYVLVWDADDSVVGDFKLPEQLTHDFYSFTFGPGTVYSRSQLFNNHKRWKYVGVLHEYPVCCEETGQSFAVKGNYHFISGKTGNRSKNPNKYLDDAKILEKAFYEAYEAKDPIYNRYAFYTAQSYKSCNMKEQAIEFYKKVLSLDNWVQEKYVACFNIYDLYEGLKREEDGLRFLVEGHKYDPRRIECIYRLVKYYCIKGQTDVALAYYTLVQNYYENEYFTDNLASRLFASAPDYDFYFPYYVIIVCDRMKRPDIAIKMYTMIFRKGFLYPGEWWIHNLFHNIQFSIPTDNATFVDDMLSYVYRLRNIGVKLKDEQYKTLDKIVTANREALGAAVALPPLSAKSGKSEKPEKARVMLTMTTCKRFNLFQQTMHSILRTWTDLDAVDYFFCVDDNSSQEDRDKMQQQFPFFTYYMKKVSEKGHRESMNIIWNKLNECKPTYWIHLEDDWLYLTSESYVGRGIALLEKYENQNIHQLVFNREYGLMLKDMDNRGGTFLEKGAWLHTQDAVTGKNCAYWPHYSMQPSIVRTRVILELGNYDSANAFFERDYAERYKAAGFKTMFFDGIYSLHIGKQHWEKEGKNAYALNETGQFAVSAVTDAVANTPVLVTTDIVRRAQPLIGTMKDHLRQILQNIEDGIPFGIIRPSDGEHHILSNKTLTNCDKWTFTSGGILQHQLMDAIQTVDPNLYIGLPCNTCNAPWNCTQKIYDDYTIRWKVPVAQRTYANLFMGANWKPFTQFLLQSKGFYVVTSGDRGSDMPIKGRYIIDETLVNTWDRDHVKETGRIMQFIQDKKGELICFSAGPLSKYWIPLCMKKNPTNMYVDVGASLDIFTKGHTNRQYTEPTSRFANDVCRFEPLNPPSKKHLVYMCVFHNDTYLELLNMLMLTVKLFSQTDTMDFLVYTSPQFLPAIQRLSSIIGIPIYTHTFDWTTQHEAGCARLYIFEYPHIAQYEKILYLDTDIIVQNDLTTLFADDLDDMIYALEEETIEKEWMGGWFFDFQTIDTNTPGINSGILLFKNTVFVRTLFQEIRTHIAQRKAANMRMPDCMDQPFLCYHIIRQAKQNTTLLAPFAQLFARSPPPFPTEPTSVILCHFAWPLGKADHKKKRMLEYMSHVFARYADLYTPVFAAPRLAKSFTWGRGFLTFQEKGVLTTWGPGSYKWLDSHTVDVTWKSFSHILRMDEGYTSFLAIRKSDFLFGVESDQPVLPVVPVLPVPVQTNATNLVYMCVFHNEAYLELLRILMCTIRLFSHTDTIDLLVCTSPDFQPKVQRLSEQIGIPIHTHCFPFSSFEEAGYARLHIFSHPRISQYEKILYIDTDIIVQNDLFALFTLDIENKVYALPEGTIEHEYHGGWYFDFTTIDKQTAGLNSGILLFKNTAEIKQIFHDILEHIHSVTTMPSCLDQPFINYHIIKQGRQDTTLLTKYATIYCMDPPPPPSGPTDCILCHFVWPIGNAYHKRSRMLAHMKHIFQKYSDIYPADPAPSIVDATYTWATGYITLGANGRLTTTWGRGTYRWMDAHTMEATWLSCSHILRFPPNYKTFFSVRTSDFDIVTGQLCGEFRTVKRHTHLVYFSIFYNSKYFKLAKAFLKSLRVFSTIAFDILLLTSPDFQKEAEELCAILPIRIHYMPFTTIFQAACARLHVFDYPDIQAYQRILYLDTDILITKDLAPLFAEPLADRLYGLGCGTISSVSFGSQFFDFTTIDGNTTGINSGTLLFRNCEAVRDLFARINAHIAEYKDPVPYTMDQPFINFHAIRDKLSDTTLLQPHVSLYEGGEVTNYATAAICHFSFPIGNSDHKYARMEAFLRTELAKTAKCTDTWFVHKSFVWGCEGTITFGESNRLRTPWGDGTYECIGENRFLAKWGRWEHVLQFEAGRSCGLSLRVAPLDFDMTPLHSYI